MAGNGTRPHLLRTKFYRPRAAGDLVRRPRVAGILTQHIDRSLTLVCAPAGFGKTTLLSDWLENCPLPNAWLSLDQYDGDLSRFLAYFAAAVRGLFPGACREIAAQLHAPVLPPLTSLVTSLANDLDRVSKRAGPAEAQRFVIVLDDYHLVQGQEVHALLGELLRHPPRSMHLILSTRQDPPFPLHMLRARGELTEIRGRDLRFTVDEIETFMTQAVGAPLDHAAVAVLAERTEGWATGLRLAAFTLNAGGDVASTAVSAENRYILDYLVNEVLSHIPAATHDFLLKTSILGQLCGSLCDAVAGAPGPGWDGSAYLEWLTQANLFTFSVDPQGNWYRYHQLFQKLLRNQLERRADAEEIAGLHRRASVWLGEHGLIDEAIQHALAARDASAALQLVETHRHVAINQENWRQLERWLGLLPSKLVATRPELMMLEAWTHHRRFRLPDLAACLDRIESAIEQTPLPEATARRLRGEQSALRCQVLYWTAGPQRTLDAAQEALSFAPEDCTYVRAAATAYRAAALQLQGKPSESVAVIEAALNDETFRDGVAHARLLFILCAIHLMEADTASVLQAGQRLLQVAHEEVLPDSETRAYFYMGCAHYLVNDLAAAERCFGHVVERRYLAHSLIATQSALGLASVYQARALPERATATAMLAVEYTKAMNSEDMFRTVEMYGAHLALLQGRSLDPAAWAASADDQISAAPMPVFFVAAFATVKLLLAERTPNSLHRAAHDLAHLHEIVEANHDARFMIEVLALQSLVSAELGDRGAAVASLRQAVRLAKPGNVIRVFVDLGPKMALLLRQLLNPTATPDHLHVILAAFGDVPKPEPVTKQHRDGRSLGAQPQAGSADLIEPLSQRELEVLALLKERLSNKEIAKELFISPMTVKRHTVNIYQKLAVNGRRDAVAKAAELNLHPGLPSLERP